MNQELEAGQLDLLEILKDVSLLQAASSKASTSCAPDDCLPYLLIVLD